MTVSYCRPLALVLASLLPVVSSAQVQQKIRERERKIQLSLFPGISTNGVYSGSYFNKFSLNLFGGLSAGNRFLEIGGISNVNLKAANGIQLAGLANIVGANAFINLSLTEERSLILKEDFESNFKGIQFAGLLNYIRDHSSGIALTAGLNVVGLNFSGFQLAGIGNSAGEHVGGTQLAGLYNIAFKSMTGFQISAIMNYTKGSLTGVQVALINNANSVRGARSTPPTADRGLQVGVVNRSREMDGVQIGLFNFGGAIRGVQVGLINFFKSSPPAENVKAGVPIALLNFGSKGSVFRVAYNELFDVNLEYTTGNCYNCTRVLGSEMPYEGKNKIFNQNALLLSFDPLGTAWAFGYGFERILLNRFLTTPHKRNEKRLISYGVRLLHLNADRSIDRQFNLLNRFHMEYGRRYKSMYWFAGLALNYFLESSPQLDEYTINSYVVTAGDLFTKTARVWPGYSVGVQF